MPAGRSAGSTGTRYDGASGVAWMPDSRRFVFGRPVQGQRTLWSAAADGSDPRQLTSDGTAAWPAVSADGRSLVFFGDRGDDTGIWRSDADGGNPRLLAKVADAIGHRVRAGSEERLLHLEHARRAGDLSVEPRRRRADGGRAAARTRRPCRTTAACSPASIVRTRARR